MGFVQSLNTRPMDQESIADHYSDLRVSFNRFFFVSLGFHRRHFMTNSFFLVFPFYSRLSDSIYSSSFPSFSTFCQFGFLSVCLFFFLSFCQFAFLSFCLSFSLPFCQFSFLSVCLSVSLPFCQFAFLSVCLSVSLPFFQFLFLSVCLSVAVSRLTTHNYCIIQHPSPTAAIHGSSTLLSPVQPH